jgi:dCMP deaminase
MNDKDKKIISDLFMIEEPNDKENKWMMVAEYTAKIFSTCSRRQYAAYIIAKNGRIVGVGYNGSAPNDIHCNQGGCPRAIENTPHGSVYDNCISIHAEANALLWSDQVMRDGGTLIVNGPPCYGCAKLIAGSGIKTVVCKYDPDYANFRDVIDYLMSQEIEVRVNSVNI